MKCKCGKPVETRSGLKYPLCYDCWWAQDPRNKAKPVPPPATNELLKPTNVSSSGSDEERAEAWADQFSEPKTHGPAARLVAKASALWGLRTSRAELLAEREKVRRLREALVSLVAEVDKEYGGRPVFFLTGSGLFAYSKARETLKETE